MSHLKMRLAALVMIAVSAFLIYINWHELIENGRYYVKMAVIAPLGIVGGIFMLLFPEKGGKPTTATDKFVAFLVFAIGMVAGIINLYMMDPGMFSWLR